MKLIAIKDIVFVRPFHKQFIVSRIKKCMVYAPEFLEVPPRKTKKERGR